MPNHDDALSSVLIDTNLFIAAEDNAIDPRIGQPAAELVRLIPEVAFRLLISYGTHQDLTAAQDELRIRRRRQLEKYTVLERAPSSSRVREQFPAQPSDNDRADLEVLNTFATGRARWLVSEDVQLRNRARRAGLDNVVSLAEGLEYFRSLKDPKSVHVPSVNEVEGYQVNLESHIFDSLRLDYSAETGDDFDTWWRDKATTRPVIVLGDTNVPEGVAALKTEFDPFPELRGRVLKICTFKIGDSVQGDKHGELLLRACVDHARQRELTRVYMEVLPEKIELLKWLKAFGFHAVDTVQTRRGQVVMAKQLAPDETSHEASPIDYSIAFGPGQMLLERAHIVPIRNHWFNQLFPDALGGDLFAGYEGCGNAIRKAYLCHANTSKLRVGDAILFMHTGQGPSRIRTVGVVEKVRRSSAPVDLIDFVGTRTVYSRGQIEDLCTAGPTLAILFRHDRVIDEAISTKELIEDRVLNGTPQTITEVSAEGVVWLRQRLGVSP